MIRLLLSFFLIVVSHCIGTINAAPGFGPGGFPMPTAEEMQEVEKMFADPEFQKMFEGIMSDISNDPSLDFLNPSAPAPVKGLTPKLDIDSPAKTPATETTPEEPFFASDNWRENFLHDFDADNALPSTDAKGSRENGELSLFKKKLPEGAQKVKVKIPTSLKNAYATFCYQLSTAVVKLKHIVTSDTLGAHGRDKLRHTFGDAASLLLTNAFKTLSKTMYIREFYLSSVENRKKMLGILDEIERIAGSVTIRDEEIDDFETTGAEAFKEQRKNIKKIETLVGSMKTVTADFAKTLDMSKEGLEKKRKEREERAKKKAERPQSRDTRQRFGGSSSSGWDSPNNSYNSRGKNNSWGNNNWGSGGYDWGSSGTGSGSDYWNNDHHETPKQPEAATPQKTTEGSNFYNNSNGSGETLSEAQKVLNDAKTRFARAFNHPVVTQLGKYINADAMNPNINKFYLETDSPAPFIEYAAQLKKLSPAVRDLELIAQGGLEGSTLLTDELSKKGKPVRAPQNNEAHKKEAADLLKKWHDHIQKVYRATTNLAMQAVKFTTNNRSIATPIVLPLFDKKPEENTDPDIVQNAGHLYDAIENLRKEVLPYQPQGLAKTIDEKREVAIMDKIKTFIAEAKSKIRAVKIARDALTEYRKTAAATGSDVLTYRKTYQDAEKALFDYQDTILRKQITPFTRPQLAKDMWDLYGDDGKKGPEYVATQVIENIDPRPLVRGFAGRREIDYENKREAQIAADAYFWFNTQVDSDSKKASNLRSWESGDGSNIRRAVGAGPADRRGAAPAEGDAGSWGERNSDEEFDDGSAGSWVS